MSSSWPNIVTFELDARNLVLGGMYRNGLVRSDPEQWVCLPTTAKMMSKYKVLYNVYLRYIFDVLRM